jgi:serine/threonine protein kinase
MPTGLPAGTMLGDYRIEEMIGRGGMGVVYRATQVNLDRSVAIKVLAPELAHDPSYRERFKREARHAAGLEHPNVVPVHATGEDEEEGTTFLVMRYVPGADLRQVIRDEGRLEPLHAAAILAQVASALDAAHRRGLVHRDVKPANILVTRNEREYVYLTDFGLTKALSTDAVMTRTGMWVGTVDYIAPEQLRGGEVDGRADVYSLGCVLYEMLTGEIPYPRDTEAAKMWAHVAEPPPSARNLAPNISRELDAVIQKAAAKEPADRFPTAGELADAATEAAHIHASTVIDVPDETRVATEETVQRPAPSATPAPPTATPPPPSQPPEPPAPSPPPPSEPGPPTAPEPPAAETRLEAPETALAATPPAPPTAPPEAAAPPAPADPPAPAARRKPPQGRNRTPLIAAVVGVAVAIVLAVVLLAGGGGDDGGGGSSALAPIKVGSHPADAVAVGDSVWVVNQGDDTITRVSTADATPKGEAVKILEAPFRVAGDSKALWAISASASDAAGIDPTASSPKPKTATLQQDPYDIAVGEGSVWVVTNSSGPGASGRLVQLDPASGERRAVASVGTSLTGVATGHGAVWVLDGEGGVLHRVDPNGLTDQAQVPVGTGATAVVTDGSAVWVASGGKLLRIDPDSNKVVKRIALKATGDVSLAAGSGSVWWIDQDGGTVTRVDPETDKAAGDPVSVGSSAGGGTVAADKLWVTNPSDDTLVRVGS